MSKSKANRDLRTFLGFGQPPLQSAVEWMNRQFADDTQLDLSDKLVVLPTSRSVFRLTQLLVTHCENNDLILTPPETITIGEFPERLYPAHEKFATDLCQQLAWSQALEQTEEETIENLFPGMYGSTHDQWQPYAKLLSDLHKRLGNDVWSFSSVVREVLKLNPNFHEIDRWRALAEVQNRYYGILNKVKLWDKQAARNVAVKRELCRTDKSIVMIGTADLNWSTKLMLEQVRDNVKILVAAPKKWSARFDKFGGIVTEQWLHSEIKFPSDCIRIVDTAEDQAFAVAHYICELGDEYSADQITIGIPDADVQPQVQRSLNGIGIKHRDLKGQMVKHTPPVRLMTAMLEFLDQQNYTTYSALIRHPDMFRWICNKVENRHWLQQYDAFQLLRLPDLIRLGTKEPFGNPEKFAAQVDSEKHADLQLKSTKLLNEVHQHVSQLFADVTGPDKPIADWTQPWCNILSEIYGDRVLDKDNFEDQKTIVACRELYQALRDKREVPTAWGVMKSASKAMQMAIEAASDWSVIPPAVSDAVELSGWLDLPLDDAPVVIIAGMNDEHVPTSENGHLFLPNKLCTDLGILDNDRRYARDAYALTIIQGVRKKLLLIAGRKDLQGEPKKPSRLLFADDNETIAERASAFFSFEGKADSRFWLADPADAPTHQQFEIPKPTNIPPVNELSVTGFKEFIRCPYRFYLSKILRLESASDGWQEMEPRAFGNLAHKVLELFGQSDRRNSTSEKQIREFLNAELDRQADVMYTDSRLPAVAIQIEQLRMRLERFAKHQAQRAAEGWEIISTEQFVVHPMLVDGEEFNLRGTIDRIDHNPKTGAIAIWDYKTSDRGDDPTKVHNPKGWKDLQLPLYRHLVKENEAAKAFDLSDVTLGYIRLPKELDLVGFVELVCEPDQLETADRLVATIIKKLRIGDFWPREPRPPVFSEAFAGICQDNAFEKHEDELEEAPF